MRAEAADNSQEPGRRASVGTTLLAVAAVLAALGTIWYRLFSGVDLEDESGWLVVPWRWALGDTPFVDEENLAQVTSFLVYPFVKAFALLRGNDVTGLVLYGRHLYLGLALVVGAITYVVLRRLLRRQLALVIAALSVALLALDSPQISSTGLAAALLTLGALLGLRSVTEPPARPWALASGVAFGLAVVAYPTLLFVVPFFAVFLSFALGRRALAIVEHGAFIRPPDPPGPPTGRNAWLVLSAWALGGVLVFVPVGLLLASFGTTNLARCWRYTLSAGRTLGQLGGSAKASEVAAGLVSLFWSRPYLLAGAVAAYLVYRRWPRIGRGLLLGLPAALAVAAQRPGTGTAALLLIAAALAPYCFVFLPSERRADGGRLLIWVWAPTLLAGAMAAYTSSLGAIQAAMGVVPAVLTGAVFVAWALESVPWPSARFPWLGLVFLVALLAVAVSLPLVREQSRAAQTTTRFTSGPWWGISTGRDEHAFVSRLAADLTTQAAQGGRLLVFYGGSGAYLLWPGDVATNSYWIRSGSGGEMGALPSATVAALRRHRVVPDVVLHFAATEGLSAAELQAGSGGLDYPTVLVRPEYAIHRRPSAETVEDVLRRLRR